MSGEEKFVIGARNPKEARFSVNLTGDMNRRLEKLSDAAGANKGTMAALCIAAGINVLEHVYLRNMGVPEEELSRLVEQRATQLASDVERQAE